VGTLGVPKLLDEPEINQNTGLLSYFVLTDHDVGRLEIVEGPSTTMDDFEGPQQFGRDFVNEIRLDLLPVFVELF